VDKSSSNDRSFHQRVTCPSLSLSSPICVPDLHISTASQTTYYVFPKSFVGSLGWVLLWLMENRQLSHLSRTRRARDPGCHPRHLVSNEPTFLAAEQHRGGYSQSLCSLIWFLGAKTLICLPRHRQLYSSLVLASCITSLLCFNLPGTISAYLFF
jgi:hypothetical protein